MAKLREAAYSVLCESNGLFDNGWRKVADGPFDWEMEFPVPGFGKTLDALGDACANADAILEPEETAKRQKWTEACSTASAIVSLFEEGLAKGETHPNLVKSSLHRNIADAINGTLKATDGQLGQTMDDLLAALVAKGDLIPIHAAIATETQRAETENTGSVEDEGAGRPALHGGWRGGGAVNAPANIGVQIHCDFEQGSERWLQARCGLLTASEFDRIITPTLKIADNVKSRAHLWEMAAQRITRHVEPQYISDAMLRGQADEILAREAYAEHFAPVEQCGFVTNSKWGFTLGCSPDGLVGDEGMIECKSSCQKLHVQRLVEHHQSGTAPEEFMLQVQGLMLITERKWCDLLLRCGGLPQKRIRVEPDARIQDAIVDAAAKFESRINEVVADWHSLLAADPKLIPTERTVEEEMVI